MHTLAGDLSGKPHQFSALNDVSFSVGPGDALAILGRNGAGKSTLLQIICGVLKPSQGSISTPSRVTGLLELGSGFNPEFTGRENVFLNGAILGMSRRLIAQNFDSIADFAEIGDFINQPVKTYSSGMFLRLAFSVAIHLSPELLVVDEALTVGDIFFRQKCYDRLRRLHAEGMALLLVTHSLTDASEFCNRGIVISQGRLASTVAERMPSNISFITKEVRRLAISMQRRAVKVITRESRLKSRTRIPIPRTIGAPCPRP